MSLTVELVSFVSRRSVAIVSIGAPANIDGRWRWGACSGITGPNYSPAGYLDFDEYLAHLRPELTQQVAAT